MIDSNKKIFDRGVQQPQSQIITVGGGKGGIGKSFISSSIAIFLANQGYRTILVDLDLGCANLHTYLNIHSVKKGLYDFITSDKKSLEDMIIPTNFPKLGLITPNDPDEFDSSQINIIQKSKIMSALYGLKADYLIFDLSAGTQELTLDFYLMGTKNLLVTTPEPTSVENAYRFIKSAFYRKLKRIESQYNLQDLIAEIMSNKSAYNIRCPHDLLKEIYKIQPEDTSRLYQTLNNFSPSFILNQTRSHRDIALGGSINSVCRKYFGLNSQFLGHVDYDNAVWQSLRNRSHLLVEYPSSQLYAQLMNIARNITFSDQKIKKIA
jgi:flagellar biosynthesis protein FlhG